MNVIKFSDEKEEKKDNKDLIEKPEKEGKGKEVAKDNVRYPQIRKKLRALKYNQQKALLKPENYSLFSKKDISIAKEGFKEGEGSTTLPYKKEMEEKFGYDLNGVKAYKGEKSKEVAEALGASAFTFGDKIAFKHSHPSKELVAHELTHVIQQTGDSGVSQDEQSAEKEADQTGKTVSQGLTPATPISFPSFRGVSYQKEGKGDIKKKAKIYAEQIRKAFDAPFYQGGTDTQEIYRLLNQPPEVVSAIKNEYNTNFNTLTGKGLIADIRDEMSGRDLEMCLALLKRADISAGSDSPNYSKQEETGKYKSYDEIIAIPHVPVAVPGTKITYSITSKGGYIYSAGSKWNYEWYCLNDPETSKKRGAPAMVKGPNSYKWDAKWDFEGNHKILCRVQFNPKGRKPEKPEWIEYQQTVMKDAELLNKEFKKAEVSPDPKKQYDTMEQYKNLLLMAETKKGSKKLDPEVKKGIDEYLKGMKKKLASTEGKKRIGIKAVHISKVDAKVSNLNVFVAKLSESSGYEEWVLVDITNPADRRLSGEYKGKGKSSVEAINNAIDDWDRDNRYPDGVLKLEIPKDAAGISVIRQFQTDGMSFWDSLSEFFNNVGLVAGVATLTAAVITAIVPEPTISKVASAALWTSIIAGGTSAVINIAQRRAEGVVDIKADLFDSMTIAGNILGGAWMKGARVLSTSKIGCKFATGIIIGRATTDAIQGILIADSFIKEYDNIMKDPNPEKRTQRLLTFLGKVSVTGGMLIISFKSAKDDLKKIGLAKARIDATKLGNPSETVDLEVKAKTPEIEGKVKTGTQAKESDPLNMKVADLESNVEAQKKLFMIAEQARIDMDTELTKIASKFKGAKSGNFLKRGSLSEFVSEVVKKCKNEGYSSVGEMVDMARGRINLENASDVLRAKEEIIKEFSGSVVKVKPPREAYPRWHIIIKQKSGLLYEVQVGTYATTKFLETRDVLLPERFMKAMGRTKPEIDFHDIMYKGLMKFKGTDVWTKYKLDDLEVRYSSVLKETGTGIFSAEIYKKLQNEIQKILNSIATHDADVIKKVFNK